MLSAEGQAVYAAYLKRCTDAASAARFEEGSFEADLWAGVCPRVQWELRLLTDLARHLDVHTPEQERQLAEVLDFMWASLALCPPGSSEQIEALSEQGRVTALLLRRHRLLDAAFVLPVDVPQPGPVDAPAPAVAP